MKGVIFDLDGTLLNTIPDLRKALNATLADYRCKELSNEECASKLGQGFAYFVKESLPSEKRESIFKQALLTFEDYYAKYYMDETKPYDGIEKLLLDLQAKNILLAVNSNKKDEYAKKLVKNIFPHIAFVDVIGMREGQPGKPNPEAVYQIARKMNLPLEDILYVGDSGADYHTALNANVAFLAVTWGFRSESYLKGLGIKNFAYNSFDIYKTLIKS